VQITAFLYGRTLYEGPGKFVEERFEEAIPVRGATAPGITYRPPQALTNMISSTREAAEELKRGLSRPPGATPSFNS
jgi:hypothetical protein